MDYKIERKKILVKINEFTEKIDTMMSMVEKGKTFVVTREGKPIAEVLSLRGKKQNWKRKLDKITLAEGVSAQSYIEEERNLR
jgi:antitoxin (DNA-binding transcriptional repressor) of toxin-antitoxin stability system